MANHRKKKKRRRVGFGRILWRIIIILCVAFLVLFAGVNMYLREKTGETLFSCLEEAKEIVAASNPEEFKFSKTSYIYSDDGTELVDLSEDTDATYLDYDDIPDDVINAFVAVEDRTFWTNSGIDYKGIARVLVDYVRSRGTKEAGASTITQQFTRAEFLTQDKNLLRKIKEIFIARELTKKYSKEQIMEFYVNTCCFANGIYGVEDASQTYFGRPVKDLSLSEVAYICAIPNRPEYYNPYNDSSNAIKRRDKILEDMLECGYISSAAYSEAVDETIEIVERKGEEDFHNYEVTYAINCVIKYLMKEEGFDFRYTYDSEEDYREYNEQYAEAYSQAKHVLYTGGYQVTTTMNLKAQKKLQKILDENLDFSEERKEADDIYKLQGAMTVIDNETGKVVAMIGGRSQDEMKQTYSLNRGYQGFAQPGSSFKPLAVYTPALNEGFEPDSLLKDIDVDKAKKATSKEISKMKGKEITMRVAVENSLNGCAYWLFNMLGPRVGLSYVMDMNFTRIVPEDYTMSASLGGLHYGVSTEEMANAYYTLENHGEFTQTDCISSIIDGNGKEIYSAPESKEIYSADAADKMTDIMMGVFERGTAKGLRWSSETSVEAAGKTGTTNDNKAGWFCGYTPYYTIAVWVGCDMPEPVDNLNGNTYPAYIWKDAMLYMIKDLPSAQFDITRTNTGYKTKEDKEEPEDEEIDELDEPLDVPVEDDEDDNIPDPGDIAPPEEITPPEDPDDIGGDDIEIPDIPTEPDPPIQPDGVENG